MAAYRKIQGAQIKAVGPKPAGNYGNQVKSTVPSGISIKGSVKANVSGKDYFAHTQPIGKTSIRGGQHC